MFFWNDAWLRKAVVEAHAAAVRDAANQAQADAEWRHVASGVEPVTSNPGGIAVKAADWQRLEFGTRPHEIEPREAQALHFADGGFSARAKHPGQRAHPFLRPAAQNYPEYYQAEARARLPAPKAF